MPGDRRTNLCSESSTLRDHRSLTSPHGYSRRELLLGISAIPLMTGHAAAAAMPALISTDVHVAGYPTVQAMQWMSEFLQRESAGRLKLRIMHSGQLGRENDTVELTRYGVIDLTRVHVGAITNSIPESQVFALPYIFESTEHMRHAMDGAPGQQVLAAMARRDLVGLAWYDAGQRCFYNTRHAVHTPEDLHGLKLRVPVSDVYIDLVGALRGNPTPLGYSDTYSALQTHLIDGAENNWQSFQSSRHYEVARYWSQTEHSYAPDLLMMSQHKFLQLSAADQMLIRTAALQSVQYMRTLWDVEEARAREKVLAAGVQFNAVDMLAFRQAAQPMIERYARNPALAALIKNIRAMA
jgi:tripartite ATP-independent transporter DctP family solute receptor